MPAKGFPHSAEARARIAAADRTRWADPVYRARVRTAMSAAMTAKMKDPLYRAKLKAAHVARAQHPGERAKRCMISRTLAADPSWRLLQRNACIVRSADPTWRAAVHAAAQSPTKMEHRVNGLLQTYYPGEFTFNVSEAVGGICRVGKLVPDWVGNRCRAVVELFGTYWHGLVVTGRSREEEGARRRDYFARYGVSTVIIWEDELDDEPKVMQKVGAFLHNTTV